MLTDTPVSYTHLDVYKRQGDTKRASAKEIGKLFLDTVWGLLSPVIVLGGIYSGLFTPTEAAAVAVVYSLIAVSYTHLDVYKRQPQG